MARSEVVQNGRRLAESGLIEEIESRTFKVPSSNRRDLYKVIIEANGETTCTCPAGYSGQLCKHVIGATIIASQGGTE